MVTRSRWGMMGLAGLAWLLPLHAYADDRDAAEIGHAIWFLGMFSLFFFSAMGLAIWLLVARLRSGPASTPEAAPLYPSLEKVWSKEARGSAADPPGIGAQPQRGEGGQGGETGGLPP